MSSHRRERVADLLRGALARALREEVRDPRIGFATVTGVDLSPDLRHARVFVSSLGSAERHDELLAGLRHAAPFLRRAVAREVRLKYVPQLEFLFDETLERGSRVERLLDELRGDPTGEDPS